jgi:hypothetical protein
MSSCLSGAAMAALDMIQAYVDGSSSSPYLVFCLDVSNAAALALQSLWGAWSAASNASQYICLTIGHALIFLVRLYVLQGPIPIDRSVILHYLESAIDLMETSDMAPNGQATHIARTCRDICRAGGIPLPQFEKRATETAEYVIAPITVVSGSANTHGRPCSADGPWQTNRGPTRNIRLSRGLELVW